MEPVTAVVTLIAFGVFAAMVVTGYLVSTDHRIARPLAPKPEPDPPFDLDKARTLNVARCHAIQRIESAGCHNSGRGHDWDEVALWDASSWYPVEVFKRCRDCGHDPRRGDVPLPPHVVVYDEDTLEYRVTIPGTKQIILSTLDEGLAHETVGVLEGW